MALSAEPTDPDYESDDVASYRTELVMRYGPGQIRALPPRLLQPNPLRGRNNRLQWASWWHIVKRVVYDFGYDAMVDKAATLTYYTVLSLAPTIVAAYSIVLLLLPRGSADGVELIDELIVNYLPPSLHDDAGAFVHAIVGTSADSTVALVISILVSLISASAYVRAFSRSANVMYGRAEGRGIVRTWLGMWGVTVLLVVGGVALMLAALLRESIVLGVLEPIAEPLHITGTVEYLTSIFLPVWRWVRYPVIVVIAVVLLAMLYYLTPNVRPGKLRLLTLGSTFALIVCGLVWGGFSVYLTVVGVSSAYGAFGTALAVLVGTWLGNLCLLIGVKIDAEVLRVKEIQAGYGSEEFIHAAPKSDAAVRARLRQLRSLRKSAAAIEKSSPRVGSGRGHASMRVKGQQPEDNPAAE